MKTLPRHVLIGLVGCLPAFFYVFNIMFSDSGSSSELVVAILITAVIYAGLGALAGWFVKSWQGGISLSLPAVLFVIIYSFQEYGRLWLHFLLMVVVVGVSCLAAYAVQKRLERK